MQLKGIEYRIAVAAALAVLLAQAAFARTYQLSVTRKDRNIYKVDGKSIIIKTRYCYEYVYSADAILRMSGRSGKLIFIEEDHSCDVEAVYEGVTLDDGRYSITVSHEDDNWYRIDGAESYIQTSGQLGPEHPFESKNGSGLHSARGRAPGRGLTAAKTCRTKRSA